MKQLYTIKLHQAVVMALSATPLLFGSSPASAGIKEAEYIGAFTGQPLTIDSSTPFKAFADYGAANQGWMHTAQFLTLTVGSAQDIENGATYDVQLSMTGRGALDNSGKAAIDNPAFALWTAGANKLSPEKAFGQHGWNPTRGPNEDAINVDGENDKLDVNESFRKVGVLNGHIGWIGYVNAGPIYTIEHSVDPLAGDPQTQSGKSVLDSVTHGGVNTTSKEWLTNPEASTTAYTNNYFLQGGTMVGSAADTATITLYGLKAGHYLIGTGGSCPDPTPNANCGIGSQYTFTVKSASTIPEDTNSTYDPVALLVNIQDVQVQDQHYQVQLQHQSDNTFKLISTQLATPPLKNQPALYDEQSAILIIPRIHVAGKYYKANLQNIGNFNFRLDGLNEIP